MKIILAGATGFIGTPLRDTLLAEGHSLVVLSLRGAGSVREREQLVFWDGKTVGSWADVFDGADAVIDLAGESIAARLWTPQQKEKILSSRIDATRAIVRAIEMARRRPSLLINASAVGYYGNVPEGAATEERGRGVGFLADVCEAWEREALRAGSLGVRVVLARFAPVLEKSGGMLPKMLAPFRFFLGGPLGSGRQGVPWVHREDVIRALLFLMERSDLSGPVNIAAPGGVPMKEFCSVLGKVLGRPSWLPVPGFVLRFVMGEMAAMVLEGQKVVPQKLLRAGYAFRYPDLPEALATILK
ncbi:MAG TPA: TIGR01777 family oxidoreductase [Candidatus Omnitrophota bacterium]|nr:TIGR01777 family oxidoreductase [Candidatus Omnitrophota bacterium]HPS36403.1 TIGR01777 family oxidoreductase [Candidatus Omnitrophota bacterium]